MNLFTINVAILIFINSLINLNEAKTEPRRVPIDIKQIRDRLQLLRQTISNGISLSELRNLRTLITGLKSAEAGQLEKEIDELLSEPFDFQQELFGADRTNASKQMKNGDSAVGTPSSNTTSRLKTKISEDSVESKLNIEMENDDSKRNKNDMNNIRRKTNVDKIASEWKVSDEQMLAEKNSNKDDSRSEMAINANNFLGWKTSNHEKVATEDDQLPAEWRDKEDKSDSELNVDTKNYDKIKFSTIETEGKDYKAKDVDLKSDKNHDTIAQTSNTKYYESFKADKMETTDWNAKALKNPTEKLKDSVDQKADLLKDAVDGKTDKIKSIIDWNADKVKDAIDFRKEKMNTMEFGADKSKELQEMALGSKANIGIKDKSKKSAEWGGSKIEGIVQIASNKLEVADKIRDAVSNSLKESIEHGTNAIIDSVQFGENKYNDIVKLAEDKVDEISKIRDSITNAAYDSIGKGTNKAKKSVMNLATQKIAAVDKIRDYVSDTIKDSIEHGANTVKDSVQFGGNKYNDIVQLAGEKVNVVNILRDSIPDRVYESIEKGTNNAKKIVELGVTNIGNQEQIKLPEKGVNKETEKKEGGKWYKLSFFNIFGNDDKEMEEQESLLKKLTAQKECIKEKLNVKSWKTGTASLTVQLTSILQNPTVVYHTETTIGEITTLTITSTVLAPSTVHVTEVLTVIGRPELSTKIISILDTQIHTIKTFVPKVNWKTKSVVLSKTQVDVQDHYETILSNYPVYVTKTEYMFRTALETSLKTYLLASTMTVTLTKIKEIPVTVTQTKGKTVEKLVTETMFKKKTVTRHSTIEKTETKAHKCKKGFFEDFKKMIKFG